MKKSLSTFILALLATVSAWAQTFTVDNLKYEVTDGTAKTVILTGYVTAPEGTLTIPATVTNDNTNYTVTRIGEDAFSGCSVLTTVNIPDGVTSIGRWAFSGCSALTLINVTEDNTTYSSENGVLFNKDKTTLLQYPIGKTETSYTIPDGVTSIGDGAFSGCSALTAVNIPDGVTSIGIGAFGGCSALTAVNIPDGVTSIGIGAFGGCSALTAVNIPDGVTSIGRSVFSDCSALTQINVAEDNTAYCSENGVLFDKDKTTLLQYPIGKTEISYAIPEGVATIGDYAFDGCSALTAVNIPDGVTSIEDYAFYDCSALTTVNIPEGVATIGIFAFSGCSALTTMNIPDGMTSIGDGAFSGCSALTTVNIPDGVTSIGEDAFSGCSVLTTVNIPDGVTSIGYSAFRGCSALTTVNIPDGVTSIGDYVFDGCSALTAVNIPGSVTSIGRWAFIRCSALRQINVAENNTTYSSENSVLFNKDKTTLLQYPIGKTETSYTIPDGVTSIGDGAFSFCSALTAVNIPGSVTSIGSFAFSGCSALTTVNIPDGVTSIGDYAFGGCPALTQINVAEDNTTYSSENGVLFNKDKTTLLQYPFGKTETSYTIPDGVTSIGHSAFSYCSTLTAVNIPGSVTSIGNSAFWDCSALTQLTVLTTVPPTLGFDVFYGVSRDIPVYVPAASLADYQTVKGWKDFTKLQAIGSTGLHVPAMPESISIQGGKLHNPQRLPVKIYDLKGRPVYSGNATTVELPAGIYVVSCNGASRKAVF